MVNGQKKYYLPEIFATNICLNSYFIAAIAFGLNSTFIVYFDCYLINRN